MVQRDGARGCFLKRLNGQSMWVPKDSPQDFRLLQSETVAGYVNRSRDARG
jgi:hypothetical protein